MVLNLGSVVKFCLNGLTVTSKRFNIFVDLMVMKSSILVSVKTEAHSFIYGLITAEQWPSDLHSSHELQSWTEENSSNGEKRVGLSWLLS